MKSSSVLKRVLRALSATVALLLAAASLQACGQRGPLYLPPPADTGTSAAKPAAAPSSAPPSAPASGTSRTQQLPAKADDGVRNPPPNDSKPATPTW